MADLHSSHSDRPDPLALRRYFECFEHIERQLPRLTAELARRSQMSRAELWASAGYLRRLFRSMAALSLKYGGESGTEALRPRLSLDLHESGLPTAAEFFHLANDAVQAEAQLAATPSEEDLRVQLLREILSGLKRPGGLEYALSQRLYAQHLAGGGLFLARNDLEALWLSQTEGERRWLLSWALYDEQMNLPVIYLLEVSDLGSLPLPQDPRRWSELQAHLKAQSLNWLKLPTITQALSADFDDLQPKGMKRLYLGPFYGAGVTLQDGPLRAALEAREGDWAIVWTVEGSLASEAAREKTGWFSSAERQIFTRDPFGTIGAETGATVTERFALLSTEAFATLQRLDPQRGEKVGCFVARRGV